MHQRWNVEMNANENGIVSGNDGRKCGERNEWRDYGYNIDSGVEN